MKKERKEDKIRRLLKKRSCEKIKKKNKVSPRKMVVRKDKGKRMMRKIEVNRTMLEMKKGHKVGKKCL